MSAVVLDASVSVSQSPAIYAETLVCGAGGVIAGTDPSVGVVFSRNYGALGAQTELLAVVRKDLSNPPTADVGGTISCAGLRFGDTIANTANAGNLVCGTSALIAGTITITANAVNLVSGTNRSLMFVQKLFPAGGAAGDSGFLTIGVQTATTFEVYSVDATGAPLLTDTSPFFWWLLNPNWSAGV